MTSANWGEVIIEPSVNGPHIAVAQPRTITTAVRHAKRLPSWVSVFFAVAMWSVPSFSFAASYTATDIINDTNRIRADHQLSALSTNTTLNAAAMAKANDMFARQYFNHVSPSGEQPWTWFAQSGYAFTSAGENLAIDFVDGDDIVPAWMKSASHRQNLLSSKYHDIGVAVVDGTLNGQATTLVVQFFGSRGAAVAAKQIIPLTPAPAKASPPAPVPVKLVAPALT
ncbi:MAG: CAP domain-containing protein, partial [Candidatus Kerfeldbacteria bacterium]|nr:CAP domain-containing protein [Candidatus Kerfeldbacteria bacterium]